MFQLRKFALNTKRSEVMLFSNKKLNLTKYRIDSKVIHLALASNVPQVIIDQLNKIRKDFIWNWTPQNKTFYSM